MMLFNSVTITVAVSDIATNIVQYICIKTVETNFNDFCPDQVMAVRYSVGIIQMTTLLINKWYCAITY